MDFSIIVPTRARPAQLVVCLNALARLDYPRDRFQVIVADDGGPVELESAVAPSRERMDVTLIRQARAGPAAARNRGAARAQGAFLAFTDDDCLPAPDWLTTLSARLASAPVSAVGGRTLNGLPDNPYSTATQMLIDYLYARYNANPERARFLASNNLAVPAELFRALGGFDETYPRAAGEDREFCDRWLSRGCRLIYAPEAIVYHSHRLTLGSFGRQHWNYGRGAWRVRAARARRTQARVQVESISFYLDLLGYPFRLPPKRRAWVSAGLLMVAQLANAAGFVWERVQPSGDERASETGLSRK